MPRRKKGKKGNNINNPVTLTQQSSEKDESKPIDVLPVNRKFAQHYEEIKRREFLSNAPAGLLDNSDESSSSSSEEEDDFGELLTKGIDRRVNETLEAIRKKDPRIYDKNNKFFEDVKEVSEESDSASDREDNSENEPVAGWDTIANAAERATPKLSLKDYVRESLLKNGRLSDDEDGLSDGEREARDEQGDNIDEDNDMDGGGMPISKITLDDADTKDEGEDGDNGSDDGDFFTKKEKSTIELEEEAKDFAVFMNKRATATSKQTGEDLLLHSYLEKETPDEKERFLRDFVLNNGWLDKNSGEAPGAHDYEIEIDTNDVDGEEQASEDEDDFEDKADNFEAQYNFRFEDPESSHIVSHARHIPDSMRRPDNRRKRAREARRLRKEQEKTEKSGEMKRLKNLKKKEIQARLLAIQEAAGDGVDLTGIDLEGDFDPDTFNKQMESRFDEKYYSTKDEGMNDVRTEGMSYASEKKLLREDRDDIPKDVRDDVMRMTDEYYNLDFEDIVGGVPMKFKYKSVEPESFSMTPDYILSTEDKELNRLVSIKYLAPYRSKRDVQKRTWKVRAALQKRKNSLLSGEEDESKDISKSDLNETPYLVENGNASMSGSRKRKRRKSKSDADSLRLQTEEPTTAGDEDIKMEKKKGDVKSPAHKAHKSGKPKNDGTDTLDEKPSKRKRKRTRKRHSQGPFDRTEMSESRLKAYGINPS